MADKDKSTSRPADKPKDRPQTDKPAPGERKPVRPEPLGDIDNPAKNPPPPPPPGSGGG